LPPLHTPDAHPACNPIQRTLSRSTRGKWKQVSSPTARGAPDGVRACHRRVIRLHLLRLPINACVVKIGDDYQA